MFAYLKGTVESKEVTGGPADRLVLDVGGVGYQLSVSHTTLVKTGQAGDQVIVHTALAIRENDWTLYGFATRQERDMFNLVQSVSGIGPRTALTLVGTFSPAEIADAVLSDNVKLLSQVPGIGSKVAQRLVLELKGKMEEWVDRSGVAPGGSSAVSDASMDAVREILDSLGYTQGEINTAIKQAHDAQVGEDVEELVRYSLKLLGSGTH